MKKIGVAYSGGIDSSLLIKICHNLKQDKVVALIAKTFFLLINDFNDAINFCESNKIRYFVLDINEYNFENISNNPKDRCYHCKKIIFSRILRKSDELRLDVVFDGSNASDSGDYRPGKKAIKELGIISPFVESNINKEEIRDLFLNENISFWDKPSNSCLVTRIPYDKNISKRKIEQIQKGEDILHNLGFKIVRLRHFDEIALIEVGKDERNKLFDIKLLDLIYEQIKELGFDFVTIDAGGYKTGNMNKLITSNEEINYG